MINNRLFKKIGFFGFSFFLLKGLLWLVIGRGTLLCFSSKKNVNNMELNVSVYDTYVPKKEGGTMHFDIIVSSLEHDLEKIHGFGREYLQTKGQEGQTLTAKECRFCHIENAQGEMADAIQEKGYFILEMEGCK